VTLPRRGVTLFLIGFVVGLVGVPWKDFGWCNRGDVDRDLRCPNPVWYVFEGPTLQGMPHLESKVVKKKWNRQPLLLVNLVVALMPSVL
jgi:hypothetical protein